jgi:hypothetical protein
LHIRLPAGWTHKHAFFIEHSTLFLHDSLFLKFAWRMAQSPPGLQGRWRGAALVQTLPEPALTRHRPTATIRACA